MIFRKKGVFAFGLCIVFLSCASYIPEKEIAIAQAALKAAQDARAQVYAPRLFQRAQDALRSAKRAYDEREYGLAKEFAWKSQTYSERAENLAVLKSEKGEE